MLLRLLVASALLSVSLVAAPDWVARSNEHAHAALKPTAGFSPESSAQLGLTGYDEAVADLGPNLHERYLKVNREVLSDLKKRLAAEKHPLVRQDLQLMIDDVKSTIHGAELNHRLVLPYINVGRLMFFGLSGLLAEQVAPERRPAALVRLRRYAGMEEGYTPLPHLAEQRTRERLNAPGLIGPPRAEVEKDLQNSRLLVDGIAQLFTRYKLSGWEEAHGRLKQQLAGYEDFVRKEILPRSRTDFRLPPELYAHRLRTYGVDIPPAELAAIAHKSFAEFQAEAEKVSAQVAKERGWTEKGYREVIRRLKKEQLSTEEIMPHYRSRIGEIEAIIRKHDLVTLPGRAARMRLATPAESAVQPAPHMRPPPLIGNKGESGEFVLPLNNPSAAGAKMDDFTFSAASWTLTAHEARPGHEMQFSQMVEQGVSIPRAVFAFNSTNAEGWGVYSEWMVYPYMPAEGQLISLQQRMMRAARAFIDPELQSGKLTPEAAGKILLEDVLLSEAMVTQEVDRYTYRSPGQATSYFYGYLRLLELRRDLEKRQGARFSAKQFHDFVLSQGLLPPALLRKAVMEQYAR